jgi:integrase
LAGFVQFVEQSGARTITTELAVAWARQPQGVAPIRWSQRLGMVRGFASYLATIDPATEIPPADVLSAPQQRVAPYIYSPEEIAALMDAARDLWPPVRAATMRTAIGLLACSGMRIGEMLVLDDADLDNDDGADHRDREMGQAAASAFAPNDDAGAARLPPTSRPATSTGRCGRPRRCSSPATVIG